MNAPPEHDPVLAPLQRLNRRVRWKRWLGKTHRVVWLLAFVFLGLFLTDLAIGLRTFSLRVCFAGFVCTASLLFLLNALTCWFARLDLLGLAQILERHQPALSERLLTTVQMDAASTAQANPDFAALLRGETAQQLATVDPVAACPLERERRAWLITLAVLGIALVGLCFAPESRAFSDRFFASWTTPLTPYRIELAQRQGFALRGGDYKIKGTIERIDPHASDATECRLVLEDEAESTLATAAVDGNGFTITRENLRAPLRCRVIVGDSRSELIEIDLVDAPVLAAVPKVAVAPPAYVAKLGAKTLDWPVKGPMLEILQYSRLAFTFAFDQPCRGALVLHSTSDEKGSAKIVVPLQAGADAKGCVAEVLAAHLGTVRAELRLDLAHGLSATIPLGQWNVHADRLPRFTQGLRFIGGSGALQSTQQYRIAPDDVLRLETAVADEEGLKAIDVEFRVNDNPPNIVKWINAAGKRQLAINERMPLPKGLKRGDRVQFRLRALDNRALRRGEVDAAALLPATDLAPQSTFAPEGGDAWIQLQVDPAIDSFVKQQAEAQSEEVRGVIEAIQMKIRDEALQVEKMKRSIHLQAALTLDQRLQAEKLQVLNREIVDDLSRAAQRFMLHPELARLAEHFLDIAEHEMDQAGSALSRFAEKDRPLSQGEKELQSAHDALLQALKKLDRLHDWNKMLAQDRLDQEQLDKLAQRQQDLADRLEALRGKDGLSDADRAKQIDEIRQEQARIAEKTDQLKDQNQLVRDSLAALERYRVEKLAQDAAKLAAEQQALRDLPPDKMPAELKERLDKLVQRQADLAKRVQAKPAFDAADALKKPNLDRAIAKQKEQEQQLQDAVAKLLPGSVANALREQMVRLATQQKEIRADLEQIGQQFRQLDEAMLKERLKNLVARQRDLQAALAKLPIDAKDAGVRTGQQQAEQSARQAANQLAVKAAYESFLTMEKTQRELEALAATLPLTLAKDRSDIKDAQVLAKLEQVETFANQQKKVRQDTEQLLADWLKTATNKKDGDVRAKMDQLKKDLSELAQKGSSPQAKALAKESAAALDQAKKAMDAGNTAKRNGEPSEKQDAEAAKQLQSAVDQLQKFAQDQAKKTMNQESPAKTAEALKAGAEQMKLAQAKLPALPKDAQTAMQAAAAKLQEAANQASQQASKRVPKAGRNPPTKATTAPGSGSSALPRDFKLEAFQGKAWGELPGELKTRMIQDYRTRYGDEYAEVIQQYFERLAQTPANAMSGRKN